MSENNEAGRFDRRTVLRNIGVGSATLAGVSGSSAATSDATPSAEFKRSMAMNRAAQTFADDAAVQQALGEYGEAVREKLAAEGIQVSERVETFDDVRTFPDHDDGVPTAHIVAEREDAERKIEFHVLPHADRTFAVETTDSGRRKFTADSVTPASDCSKNTYCEDYCQCTVTQPCGTDCYAGYKKTERCCLYADGSYECEIIESYCSDDCPGKQPCS